MNDEPFYSKEMHDNHVKALASVTQERDNALKSLFEAGKIAGEAWKENARLRAAFERYLQVTKPLLDDTIVWAEANAALKPDTGE